MALDGGRDLSSLRDDIKEEASQNIDGGMAATDAFKTASESIIATLMARETGQAKLATEQFKAQLSDQAERRMQEPFGKGALAKTDVGTAIDDFCDHAKIP